MIRRSRWVLAAGASGTAICLSVLAGWQRGGSLAERLVWVAISVVLVVSAHLLPALVRDAPPRIRIVTIVLWVACMAIACFGHATFFLLAQRHAGELRAGAVPKVESLSGRDLTAVMAARAGVIDQLATATARPCHRDCPRLAARRITLAAKLDALEAEASEIQHQQAADARAAERRDALAADPVTARLATLLGTTTARVDLLSGLAFAAVLESVACVLWTVALRSQPSIRDAASVASLVAESHASDRPPVTPLPAELSSDPDVTRLASDVAAGQVRPTVADIRRHLSCSQARAVALRRRLAELALPA